MSSEPTSSPTSTVTTPRGGDPVEDGPRVTSTARGHTRFQAYLKLFRLPNVFTAIADVVMGLLCVHASQTVSAETVFLSVLLIGASSLMYIAGMVLNDAYDYEQDSRERPHRPLPSGQIHRVVAFRLGGAMLAGGASLGWLASLASGQWRSGIVASLLALCVWAYDSLLKRTFLAPIAMGACRAANVLLGMSPLFASAGDGVLGSAWSPPHLWIALGMGLYITGLTWFARTEAKVSGRVPLAAGTLISLAGLGIFAYLPSFEGAVPLVARQAIALGSKWRLLWGALAMSITWRRLAAIFEPSPAKVQTAVKNGIFSIIVIDAALAAGAVDLIPAAAILLLLLPTIFLGRWIYST